MKMIVDLLVELHFVVRKDCSDSLLKNNDSIILIPHKIVSYSVFIHMLRFCRTVWIYLFFKCTVPSDCSLLVCLVLFLTMGSCDRKLSSIRCS